MKLRTPLCSAAYLSLPCNSLRNPWDNGPVILHYVQWEVIWPQLLSFKKSKIEEEHVLSVCYTCF
jgi:hypothetical protein